MTTFYLIRHAEAEGNLYRRMHGQYETMLTPNGMRQVAALAERFRDLPIDACYASDLLRTRTTAQAITVPKDLPLIPEPAFRELYVGIWENTDFGDLQTFQRPTMTTFSKDPKSWNVEGSEPYEAYTERFISALKRIAAEREGQTVAVFSHAAVMRGVIMRLFPQQPVLPTDNTSVTKLEYENGTFRLLFLNDNSHLPTEISTLAAKKAGSLRFEETDHLVWRVWEGETPCGKLVLREIDDRIGCLAYMELDEPWRGCGRAVQLLGKAVFTFRDLGKSHLIIQKSQGLLDDLCRRMDLRPDENGVCTMDIRLRMLPYVPQD